MAEFWIRIYDKNGGLQKVLDKGAMASWEYNRTGGCGQASVQIPTSDDTYEHSLKPGAFVQIFINAELRYSGKLIRTSRSVASGQEMLELTFYGYLIDFSSLIVSASYTGQGIKAIIQDILDTYVLPFSDVSYSDSDIDDPGYSVSQIDLNHTVRDAIGLLASLSGNVEWGVDRNKHFFFKLTDSNIRNVYVLGREITSFTEERKDDEILNTIHFFGGGGLQLTVQSSLSVSIFGKRETNLFDTSITVQSDAFKLIGTIIKNSSSFKRSVKVAFSLDDAFIERTLPIGAASVTRTPIRLLKKYGTFKYGASNQYGNLNRDQFSNIRYQLTGGGMSIDATLLDDVPNIGDLQKRYEFEIKDLQRR